MVHQWIAFVVSVLAGCGCVKAHVSMLFPMPNSVQHGFSLEEVRVLLDPRSFQFTVQGDVASKSDVLTAAVARYHSSTFPKIPAVAPSNNDQQDIYLNALDITVADATGELSPDTDESYNLTVTTQGAASLSASTVFAALRGLETFSQLVDFAGYSGTSDAPVWEISSLPIEITDSPRFKFRGLMIDTSRHFLPLSLIIDNLDVMAYNKLNVLHWHIVDSQSFPYKPVDPSLSSLSKGAWSWDHTYTVEDVKKVIREAYLRGIRVIPEFDTPGHTQSWGQGIPDILSHCPNPSEPLDPSNPLTFQVLTSLYKEISQVFKDEYVHLGGDEVSFDCWSQDANITRFMNEQNLTDYAEVEQYFETKLLQIVGESLNKKTIVWQEIFNNGLKVRPDTVVNVWKGYDSRTIEQATAAGLQVVVSGCWYLDHLNDDWDTFYNFDIQDFNGTAAQKALVIGGHSSMWGEHVDVANFMSRTWPRASSVAEKLWVNEQYSTGQVRPRLADFRCRMVARGVPADSIGPGFCAVEVEYEKIH